MLRLLLLLLLLSLVSAWLGFGTSTGELARIARVLFIVFASLLVISFALGRKKIII